MSYSVEIEVLDLRQRKPVGGEGFMYHCRVNIYLVNASHEFQNVISNIQPLEQFEHHICCKESVDFDDLADADLVIAVWDDNMAQKTGNVEEWVKFLCQGRKENADLILCIPQEAAEQVGNLDLTDICDIWKLPLSSNELSFHFLRWQKQNKDKKDRWMASQYLDTLIDSVPQLIWYKDKQGAHMKVNQSFCNAVNKTKDQIRGRGHFYIWDLDPEEYAKGEFICMESEYEVMEKKETCIFDENVKIGNEIRQFDTYKSPLFDLDGSVMGTVGFANDVTQEKLYEAMMIKRANTDFLTGLYNRRYLLQYIESSSMEPMVFFYLDLDNFKSVNDRYGHQTGDMALVMTADVLKEEMPDALIARIGGDEFLVVQSEEMDKAAIEKERLHMADILNCAFHKNDKLRKVSASIGTAYSPAGEATNADLLLEEADNMMYQEKKEKKQKMGEVPRS
jgi:diguanylate cyclase (GGDEF)-like protein/PAS domain S-box-containing protein